MKKRIIMLLLAVSMVFAATGCGKTRQVVSTNFEDEDMPVSNKEDEETGTEETKEDDKEEQKKGSGVVLGGDFEEDYDGFSYLYCETLMTESTENEETGKMEKQSLDVFIPIGDYSSVNRDTAYAEKMGVEFRVTLNPYIQYDQEDYLAKENLDFYMEYEFDEFWITSYKAVEVTEAEDTENGARATASYILYDSWNDEYYPIYCTYYLTELSKDMQVLVEVKINLEDVTGKTEAMLEEIEAFYGFDVEWDAKQAQNKLDDYMANGNTDTDTFSTGYLLFELPKGWEQDYGYSDDYSIYAYAPGGDADKAGCVITIFQEYLGSDYFDVEDMLADTEETKKFLEESIGDGVEDIEITDYGTTCLGTTMKITFTIKDGSYEAKMEWYTMSDGDYVYSVQAIVEPDCTEDVFTLVEDILANGKVREW